MARPPRKGPFDPRESIVGPGGEAPTPRLGGGLDAARRAVEEAKRKAEASKAAALGYYGGVSAPPSTAISPALQQEMLLSRRAQLGAYGQRLTERYTDPYSGVQGAQRRQIGLGIAGRQANIPIELQLEIARANLGASQYAAQFGLARAGGMAGIETAYEYDPGLEYIKQLGYGKGYEGYEGRPGPLELGGTETPTPTPTPTPPRRWWEDEVTIPVELPRPRRRRPPGGPGGGVYPTGLGYSLS